MGEGREAVLAGVGASSTEAAGNGVQGTTEELRRRRWVHRPVRVTQTVSWSALMHFASVTYLSLLTCSCTPYPATSMS
jgi:hypothetical protein